MFEQRKLSLVKVLTIAAIGAAFAAVSPAQARDGQWYQTCTGIKLSGDKSTVEATCKQQNGQSVPAFWKITGLQYYTDRNALGFTPYDNTYQRFCKDLTIVAPAGAPVRLEADCKGKKAETVLNLKNTNGKLAVQFGK